MNDYLDVGQFRQTKNGKWRFIKLGSAKKNDKGQLDVYLDALPISDSEGNCRITISQRQERQQDGPQHVAAPDGNTGMDDEIPF